MKLYDYQIDCLNSLSKEKKGKVCLPTGTGKTLIQASLIADDIVQNKGFRIYVINAPRIMLSYQLLREVYKFLVGKNIEARYMGVHSGSLDDIKELEDARILSDIPYSQIESSTSSIEIAKFLAKSQAQDLPVIFFSTYNSADRIEAGRKLFRKIDICVNDEAHYLVQFRFNSILKTLSSERTYFFTATMQNTPSDLGTGMNNEEYYGKLLYEMKPREAIDKGKMLRPRLHFVMTTKIYDKVDLEKSFGHIIEESFKQHQYAIGGINPKMLVSVSGTSDIIKFMESPEYSKLIKMGVGIYAVSSNENIGNNINGVNVGRQEFLKRLGADGKDPGKRLIILHFDILTEGLDISGITGVLLLRGLGKSKFLQTYGRAARLSVEDRESLGKGMGVHDLNRYLKPYAWVIIPTIIHEDQDNKEMIGNFITELREYGFNPSEDIVITNDGKGMPILEGPEALNVVKKKSPNIGEYIEKVEADYEDERISRLGFNEFINEISQ